MKNSFSILAPQDIKDNTFSLIGKDWMLITGGERENFNTMTASWGGFGILWHKEVTFCFVRPTRYTYGFMENSGFYSLSFFTEAYREALNICGTTSGRDTDKAADAGLTPVEHESGAVYFQEARLVMVCRKLYFDDLEPAHFLDPEIETHYPQKDYHRLYVGELTAALFKPGSS